MVVTTVPSLSSLSRNEMIALGTAILLGLMLGGIQGVIAMGLLLLVCQAIVSPPAYLAQLSMPSLGAGSGFGGGGGGGGGGRGRGGGTGNVR